MKYCNRVKCYHLQIKYEKGVQQKKGNSDWLLFNIKRTTYQSSYIHHYDKEEFEDTKGVIRICKSKKDRQYNDQIRTKGKRRAW
jgi:hypothetical protein